MATDYKWQGDLAATRVTRVARADHNTAPPDVVTIGDAIDWTGAAGWEANPWEFHEDDFEIENVEDDAIMAKGAGQPLKRGLFRDAVPMAWERVTVPSKEVGAKLFDWATNIERTGSRYVAKAKADRCAFIIEMAGVGFAYMPSVEIYAPITAAGKKSLTRQGLRIEIFGVPDLPEGTAWYDYGTYS